MHPVVQHILARQHAQVPGGDGRTIALVQFGGLMAGVRGAGALIALQELGLTHAFDHAYGTSAGFANLCYFLTGDMHVGASIYYENLCSKEFLNLERVWDIVNIDYLLSLLRTEKKLDYSLLSASSTNLAARLYSLVEKKTIYKTVTGLPADEIERVMHAAVSLPFLNPGSVTVDNEQYKDADLAKKTLEFRSAISEVLASEATDILIIYNYPEQFEYMREAGITDSNRLYQIVPYKEHKLSRISTNSTLLREAALDMGTMVKSIFGSNEPIQLD